MSDPFFTRPEHRKRKAKNAAQKKPVASKRKPQNESKDEDLASISSDSDMEREQHDPDEENEDAHENAAEKRLRIAKDYLDQIKNEIGEDVGFNAEEVDRELLSERLQEDVLEKQGKMYLDYASRIEPSVQPTCTQLRGRHSKPLVGLIMNEEFVYSADKSGLVQKWKILNEDTEGGGKTASELKLKPVRFSIPQGGERDHVAEITCLAISNDGRWVVTGGLDHRVVVRDSETLTARHCWKHHRDAILALAFRKGTNEMFSAAADRSIKVWSLDSMSYVETLFGHQDIVNDVDAFSQERCITVGGRDRSSRLWKIVEESQLVFRSGGNSIKMTGGYMEGSVDCVTIVDENHFITGSDNGVLALWSLQRKKPVYTYPLAHGLDTPLAPERHSAEKTPLESTPPPQPRWITSLRALPYANLFVSGSWDGTIRLWRIADGLRSFEPVELEKPLATKSIINSLSLSIQGRKGHEQLLVLAACGREFRYGRWKNIRNVANRGFIFQIPIQAAPALQMSNGTE
ncbi:U3 snoRNP-associated protein Rrp9 [Schizosaccharomyces osmophilus]|uniref:U3 snoRNP-associated protein Rrp9 n=1 Tax=Schizosaccharomyces osmophilus TaxID=2545709 RepID=A0AAE9W6K7_9SCHI|nr:U3 snoRNP-associated protein Rrp9 [Schizosaccharomyces osmophilus]WBW70957.1 U3 snoRNP-associated protein Rrp9 [Schizosaccharomyces osmophilus]